jgi:hypothetical protein
LQNATSPKDVKTIIFGDQATPKETPKKKKEVVYDKEKDLSIKK